jgi:hypothetical protein
MFLSRLLFPRLAGILLPKSSLLILNILFAAAAFPWPFVQE